MLYLKSKCLFKLNIISSISFNSPLLSKTLMRSFILGWEFYPTLLSLKDQLRVNIFNVILIRN